MSVAGRRRGGEGSGSGAALGTQQPPGAGGHPHVLRPIFLAPLLGHSSSEGPAACPHGGTGPGGQGCPHTPPPFPLRSTPAPQPHTEHLLARQGGNGGDPAHTGATRVCPTCGVTPRTPQTTHACTLTRMSSPSRTRSLLCAHSRGSARCYTRACGVPRGSGVTRVVQNVSHVLAAICACVCVTTRVHTPISHVCAHKLPHECPQCHTRVHTHHLSPCTCRDPRGPHRTPQRGRTSPEG